MPSCGYTSHDKLIGVSQPPRFGHAKVIGMAEHELDHVI